MTLALFLAVSTAFAQGLPGDVPGGGDGVGDPMEPVAPIADYILPMLAIGVVTAYVLLRKKATAQV